MADTVSSINSQVTETVANMNALLAAQGPATSFAMLDLALTQSLAATLQNMVQRQQQASLAAAAAVNAACARIVSARSAIPVPVPIPPVPVPPAGELVVPAALAAAQHAIELLKGLGSTAAAEALVAIAQAAAPGVPPAPPETPPAPASKAAKRGEAQS